MHKTALKNGKKFFETYLNRFSDENLIIVDIGAQNVNGSLKDVLPINNKWEYIGVDFQEGSGVDLVLDDPYVLPFDSNSIDAVVSSSCFEHSEMFWVLFNEIMRILKSSGVFYMNVPSDGAYHRYPVDCWRFYPDSGKALVEWGKRCGIETELIESYTQVGGGWFDYVAIFFKGEEKNLHKYPNRIIATKTDFENGYLIGRNTLINPKTLTQNERTLFNNKILLFFRLIKKLIRKITRYEK